MVAVYENHVTRFCIGLQHYTVLIHIVVDLFLVLEDTVRQVTVEVR